MGNKSKQPHKPKQDQIDFGFALQRAEQMAEHNLLRAVEAERKMNQTIQALAVVLSHLTEDDKVVIPFEVFDSLAPINGITTNRVDDGVEIGILYEDA